MANRLRGEIDAEIDGEQRRLCLTLGALAELESAFGASDLAALADRFQNGRLSARDVIHIIACGLRGGGMKVSDTDVAGMRTPDGLIGFIRIAADLVTATFGDPKDDSPRPSPPQDA